ncbi:hypothetical protein ACFQ6N_17225 [Kitasatospora sp. NPDC056446]|uniref:hypothetical protein n=1 Tax=Kitasatospora sp. NPDC056446 TaxID=3345819 RepID=UPI003681AB31
MRRRTSATAAVPVAVPAAVLVLAVAALTGCTSSGSGGTSAARTATSGAPEAVGAPADATGAFDPELALARRTREPYSATVHMTVETGSGDDRTEHTVDGRLNFNTKAAGGHTVARTEGPGLVTSTVEEMDVEGVGYERPGGEGGWQRSANTGSSGAADKAAAYARAVLDTGTDARKGMETVAGVPVFHVGARLTVEQVRTADPENADRLSRQGVTGADCQLWFDRLGRMVQGEQSLTFAGQVVVTRDLYTAFGPAEAFIAPLLG